MGNLSDVEFGSNKDKEEAPILVAQRYLNIFRQIHVFGEDKRNQFDDELLALPQNITDFFKRMPGGRLLVEHIEDVKTARGISFVKVDRSEFSNDTSDATPSPAESKPGQIVGGSVVMDASFAETFSKAMAEAFKQIPQGTVATGSSVPLSLPNDFGQAFGLIADEIKNSRLSLIDILNETRNVTDTVIASQISTSRLLEGLVTNSRNDFKGSHLPISFTSDGLSGSNPSSLTSKTLDILDSKLLDAKQEIHNDVEQSLAEIRTMLYDCMQKVENSERTVSAINDYLATLSRQENTKSIVSNTSKNAHDSNFSQTASLSPVGEASSITVSDTISKDTNSTQKNISSPKESLVLSASLAGVSNTKIVDDINPSTDSSASPNIDSNVDLAIASDDSILDNVVSDDDLDFAPPTDENSNKDINIADSSKEEINTHEDISSLDSFVVSDDLDFALPDSNNGESISTSDNTNSLDRLIDSDGLDFDLPDDNNDEDINTSDDSSSLDSFVHSDGLNFALPDDNNDENINTTENSSSLDSFVHSDDLDFDLPDDNNAENVNTADASNSLDSLINSDGLDFALPDDNSEEDVSTSDNTSSLGSFVDPGSLDFAMPDDNNDEDINTSDDSSSLDSFVDPGSLDFAMPDDNADEDINTSDDSNSLDNFIDPGSLDFAMPDDDEVLNKANTKVTPQETKSRYSAELDKIRQALTSENVDISSLDMPIALDDYNDDENTITDNLSDDLPSSDLPSSDLDEHAFNHIETPSLSTDTDNQDSDGDDSWEWEYVEEDDDSSNSNEENGDVPNSDEDDQDWEWEYVEDDSDENNVSSDENNNQ